MILLNQLNKICRELWNCDTEGLAEEAAQEKKLWYGWLFEGAWADISIPLWESHYTGEQHVLMNAVTLEVRKCYLEKGLDISADCHQPADYIGLELEFFLYLLTADQPGTAGRFYQNHLSVLMKEVFTKVREYSGINCYTKLADTALQAASELDRLLGEDPEGFFRHTAAKQFPEHFRPVSKKQAEEILTPRIIKSAGWGNCGGACSFLAETAGGCVLDIHSCDQKRDPLTLPLCIRGKHYRGTFLSSSRLRYPLLRVGKRGEGKFRRISWKEALDLLQDKISFYTAQYGPGCRFVNYSSGVSSVISGDYALRRMFGLGGGYLGNFNSYSSACIFYTLPYVYGTTVTGSSLESFSDTKTAIFWGNNPVVTEHTDQWSRLIRRFKENHTNVILIDPRYQETGKALHAQWIPIRPDTDAALAAAMAYVLWEEKLCNQAFMDRFCIGFDSEHMPEGMEQEESWHDYIYGIRDGIVKTPEWAEQYTGIPAGTIESLARTFADGPVAVFAGRGCQRNASGEQNVRSITALCCMMGYVGLRGGGTGYHCVVNQHQKPGYPLGDNPYRGSIPSFLWTDAILDGRHMTKARDHIRGLEQLDSDIKLLFSLAGNTLINQHSDSHRAVEILSDESKCEFITVSDLFMTASARYADLLLPGTSLFEEEFITKPWGDGNYLLYGNRCTEPLFGSRFEVDWILELAQRLGIEGTAEGCSSVSEWYRMIYERTRTAEPELPEYDLFRENGGYRYQNNRESIAFEQEINDPEHFRFPTDSGKIEIFSRRLWDYHEEDIPAVPKMIHGFEGVTDPLRNRYPLQVVGWHTKVRTHSVGDQNAALQNAEPHRVWISRQDAQERGITENELVEVFNDRGVIRIRAAVTEDLMPGVIGIPQGAWFTPDENGVDVRGCVNTLTTARPTALAKANPQHSCLAEIRKYRG